jgi:cellulose synthase/poly-beta-1,6-N-acetylglucosamine synthase-like glycosyltransferase/putative flippase GtrA
MTILRYKFLEFGPKWQFLIAGGSGWIIGLVLMKLFIGGMGLPIKTGTAMMLAITFAYTYAINRYCTWRDREVDRACLAKYVTTRSFVAAGTWLAVPWLVELQSHVELGPLNLAVMDYLQANTFCVLIGMVINWAICDRWVFTSGVRPKWAHGDSRLSIFLAKTGRRLVWALAAFIGLVDAPQLTARPAEMVRRDNTYRHPGGKRQRLFARRDRWLPAWLPKRLKTAIAISLLVVSGFGLMIDARATLITAIAVWTLPLTIISWRSLGRTVYRAREPYSADYSSKRITEFAEPKTRFDFYVPARKELILLRNLRNIMKLAKVYPPHLFRIYVAVAEDDPDTEALARRAKDEVPDNIEVVIVEGSRNKPVSLNHVLFNADVSGEWQITLDAESDPSPLLLNYLDTLIQRKPEVAVWQLPVHLMNIGGRPRLRQDGSPYPKWHPGSWQPLAWWQGHNGLEYRVWFLSAQDYQADRGYLTFAGNTVACRTDILKAVGGWPEMLTEDAALGIKVSSLLHELGLQIRTFFLDELVTREQTPPSLWRWLHQRIRWLQGFMEVKKIGDWRLLPGWRQRLLAWETLSMPAFQAISGAMVPLSLATVWALKASMAIVMWTFLPAIVTGVYMAVLVAFFREFCRAFQLRAGPLYMARFILTIPLYQLLLSIAAVWAKVRDLRGINNWVVTPKDDIHFTDEIPQGVILHEPGVAEVA